MKVVIARMLVWCLAGSLPSAMGQDFATAKAAFAASPSVYANYEALSALLSTHFGSLTLAERGQLRDLFLSQSRFSKISTCTKGEAGDRLVLRGRITDPKGMPVAGARIVVYQTDSHGYYAPPDSLSKKMSESDSRLYGVMRTGTDGRYELETVRPFHYPLKYEGRFIPPHIHFDVSAPGYSEVRVQMTFDDDVVMQDVYWQQWARKLGFPIVHLTGTKGERSGTCDFVVKPGS